MDGLIIISTLVPTLNNEQSNRFDFSSNVKYRRWSRFTPDIWSHWLAVEHCGIYLCLNSKSTAVLEGINLLANKKELHFDPLNILVTVFSGFQIQILLIKHSEDHSSIISSKISRKQGRVIDASHFRNSFAIDYVQSFVSRWENQTMFGWSFVSQVEKSLRRRRQKRFSESLQHCIFVWKNGLIREADASPLKVVYFSNLAALDSHLIMKTFSNCLRWGKTWGFFVNSG